MKHRILNFISIAIILFFGACSDEALFIENDKEPSTLTNSETERTVSLTASMPDNNDDNPITKLYVFL